MDYETIELKTFIEIAETGNVGLLGGSRARNERAWEKIVERNNKERGSFKFDNYRKLFVQTNLLRADYLAIKATLTRLSFRVDEDDITFLRQKGYKIVSTSAPAYEQSLLAAIRRSDNLISRITLKQNELERFATKQDRTVSFETLIAQLSIELGFNVLSDVKLSWYNAAWKTILEKQKHGGRRGTN